MTYDASADHWRTRLQQVKARQPDAQASPEALERFARQMVGELARAWTELKDVADESGAPHHTSVAHEQRHVAELTCVREELRAVTEEVIAQRAALEASEQRYHQLFDLAPEAYVVTDTAGIIQEANYAASVLCNLPKAELPGYSLASSSPPMTAKHFWPALWSSRTARASQDGKSVWHRGSGRRRWSPAP
jgi:PAS domain-containing protein